MALGDSYTIGEGVPEAQRWPVQLMDALSKNGVKPDTLQINAVTGWRTDNLLNAISNKSLDKKKFNLVSLLIGVNNQYQNKPISQYKKEFPQLLDSAIRYVGGDKSKVFVLSIPDYAYTPFGQAYSDTSKVSSELDQYNALNKYYSDSAGVKYFDITPISRQGVKKPEYVAGDGLHPSGMQYTRWVELIIEYRRALLTGELEQKKRESEIKYWPNPVQTKLYIQSRAETEITITDIRGRILSKQVSLQSVSIIDMNEYDSGLYFLKIRTGDHTEVRKVVKD